MQHSIALKGIWITVNKFKLNFRDAYLQFTSDFICCVFYSLLPSYYPITTFFLDSFYEISATLFCGNSIACQNCLKSCLKYKLAPIADPEGFSSQPNFNGLVVTTKTSLHYGGVCACACVSVSTDKAMTVCGVDVCSAHSHSLHSQSSTIIEGQHRPAFG